MQTFLPYPDFQKTAECLDYRRLGKQRVEAKQIHDCLTAKGSLRWKNHPAVKMWKGYEYTLAVYHDAMIVEWIKRGYKNNMLMLGSQNNKVTLPARFNEQFHASHRSNLLRKDYEYYKQFGWKESNNLPYVWPIND